MKSLDSPKQGGGFHLPICQAMESPDHLLANFAVELLRRAGHLPGVNASNRPRLALKEVMWKLEEMGTNESGKMGTIGSF